MWPGSGGKARPPGRDRRRGPALGVFSPTPPSRRTSRRGCWRATGRLRRRRGIASPTGWRRPSEPPASIRPASPDFGSATSTAWKRRSSPIPSSNAGTMSWSFATSRARSRSFANGRRRRRASSRPQRQTDALRRYREVALRAWDIVDLSNLPEGDVQIATQKLLLRQLYMPLRLQVEVARGATDEATAFDRLETGREARRRREAGHPVGTKDDEWRARSSVGRAAWPPPDGSSCLGDPGGGKTTTLRLDGHRLPSLRRGRGGLPGASRRGDPPGAGVAPGAPASAATSGRTTFAAASRTFSIST